MTWLVALVQPFRGLARIVFLGRPAAATLAGERFRLVLVADPARWR
jgi:hypothetical protein